jgi:predicted metal-dependent peptidase
MDNKGTSTDLTPATHVDDVKAATFNLEPHRVKMMLDEPFFAGVLRGVNYEKTDAIPTAGVLAKDGDVHMWWNPKFLAGLTDNQVKGLLKHEAMHLALEHTTSRRMTPHVIHNYATDLAINSDIPENELPEGGLIPGKAFKELSEEDKAQMSDDSIARYDRVSAKIKSFPRGESSEWYFTQLMEDDQISKDIQEGNKPQPGDGPAASGLPGGMDEHSGWDELSDEERELVKGKIAKSVEDAVKDCDRTGRWGSIGSSTRQHLRDIVSKEVNWRSVLRKFCGLSRRADRRSNVRRLNRKYTGIHPGVERGYTSSIAVYIDQSGSVGNAELELAFAELRNLAKRTQFTTFHFDTSVDTDSETEWRRGKTPDARRTRCGGTNFQCVTKHANTNSARFDGYIIITDGEASKPTPSKLKRGWLLVPGTKLIFDADNRDFVMKMKNSKKDS